MIQLESAYRSCVGIVLWDTQGRIFTGKPLDGDYWQMPQGGVEDGEELEQAAFRELLEETGTNKAACIAKSKGWIYYDWPKEMVRTCRHKKYVGQKQIWFLMKFFGKDQNIHLGYSDHPAFKEWCWQSIDNVIHNAISFKKEVYKMVKRNFFL